MELIYNIDEYKKWIIVVCFNSTSNDCSELIDDADIDNFITQTHPLDYPCVCLATPGPVFISSYSILFIYRNQINEWAKTLQEARI